MAKLWSKRDESYPESSPRLVPASGPRLLLSKQQTYFGAQEAQQQLTIFHLSLLPIRAVLLT